MKENRGTRFENAGSMTVDDFADKLDSSCLTARNTIAGAPLDTVSTRREDTYSLNEVGAISNTVVATDQDVLSGRSAVTVIVAVVVTVTVDGAAVFSEQR